MIVKAHKIIYCRFSFGHCVATILDEGIYYANSAQVKAILCNLIAELKRYNLQNKVIDIKRTKIYCNSRVRLKLVDKNEYKNETELTDYSTKMYACSTIGQQIASIIQYWNFWNKKIFSAVDEQDMVMVPNFLLFYADPIILISTADNDIKKIEIHIRNLEATDIPKISATSEDIEGSM